MMIDHINPAPPPPEFLQASFALCFSGEGSEAFVLQGWDALIAKFRKGVIGHENDCAEWQDWLQDLMNLDDMWNTSDLDGLPYRFSTDVGEISKVTIFRLSQAA